MVITDEREINLPIGLVLLPDSNLPPSILFLWLCQPLRPLLFLLIICRKFLLGGNRCFVYWLLCYYKCLKRFSMLSISYFRSTMFQTLEFKNRTAHLNGQLPWSCKVDMKHFIRDLTSSLQIQKKPFDKTSMKTVRLLLIPLVLLLQ